MRSLIAIAVVLLGMPLHAEERFAPTFGRDPVAGKSRHDAGPDSPYKVDFSVDFSATQTPLTPRKDPAAARPARSGALDQPVDRPFSGRMKDQADTPQVLSR